MSQLRQDHAEALRGVDAAFPRKAFFNSGARFVETRRAQLESFLQDAMDINEIRTSPHVREFLGQHPIHVFGGTRRTILPQCAQ